jgi:hypothetical protein
MEDFFSEYRRASRGKILCKAQLELPGLSEKFTFEVFEVNTLIFTE